ncbi:unnamed protein product [Urochloa decumbens]|uniref:Sulfotransferase n=1 Tax=Urochloa decumbens TaxID=240449 RepID=A0ABC9B3U8_9POAL
MSSCSQTFPSTCTPEAYAAEAETDPELYQHFANLVSSLPSANVLSSNQLYRHDQAWHASLPTMVGTMVADACFTACPLDIIIATVPKSGTTWMKSLLIPDLKNLPDPRLFATHVPFGALPRSAMEIGCKVVYVCHDPKDTLISLWNFINRFRVKDGLDPLSVETATKLFSDGLSPVGPYWDHVLGYWRAHLAHPEQVLFFMYEEMHRDPSGHVRRLAEFVGRPFGVGEEDGYAVEAIVRLCSFSHMSELHVNKEGKTELVVGAVENSSFFRRGMVGDWANHLSPKMARQIDEITRAKFKDSGLSF